MNAWHLTRLQIVVTDEQYKTARFVQLIFLHGWDEILFLFLVQNSPPPFLDRLYQSVGSCARYIQHRETLLVEEVKDICEDLSRNPYLRM